MEVTGTVHSVLARKGSAVSSISPDATVYEAVARMAEEDIGALAVIENRRLAGIFSERDYARKVILLGRSSKDTKVSEAMTHPAVCVLPEESVEDCMRLMSARRNRHVLVLDRGELCGIVSIGDLVNWIISAQAETIDHLTNYIAGSYPR
ncbi:MAG: CBS domain-containing protein [Acidobacteriota bacterium]